MTQEFIPYEQALALKELGFDEPCFATYYPNKQLDTKNYQNCTNTVGSKYDQLTTPLYQQAFRWFRKKYNYHFSANKFTNGKWTTTYTREYYDSYEEAELACLRKLIEFAKTNQ